MSHFLINTHVFNNPYPFHLYSFLIPHIRSYSFLNLYIPYHSSYTYSLLNNVIIIITSVPYHSFNSYSLYSYLLLSYVPLLYTLSLFISLLHNIIPSLSSLFLPHHSSSSYSPYLFLIHTPIIILYIFILNHTGHPVILHNLIFHSYSSSHSP
jgi:hypothetical protein